MTGLDLHAAETLMALMTVPGVGPATALKIARGEQPAPPLGDELDRAHAAARECERRQVQLISFFDDRYPVRLRGIPVPPPVLWVKGNASALHERRLVAVVGTRDPSLFGQTATDVICDQLTASGFGVVSGLARGVDTLGHLAAARAGAPNVAVLGNGLDRIRPAENQRLADAIVRHGWAVCAEVPFRTAPDAGTLTQRNRLQSGLACGVLVAQSDVKGGTMHTARFALEQGRPVFCPQPKGDHPKNRGLDLLLRCPARELWRHAPAFKAHRRLCEQAGDRPLARPVTRETVAEMVGALERWLERERPPAAEPDPLF